MIHPGTGKRSMEGQLFRLHSRLVQEGCRGQSATGQPAARRYGWEPPPGILCARAERSLERRRWRVGTQACGYDVSLASGRVGRHDSPLSLTRSEEGGRDPLFVIDLLITRRGKPDACE